MQQWTPSSRQALAGTPGVAATPAFPDRAADPQAYLINLVPITAPQDRGDH
jgi:hypothetical protein